jgi:hypothetical protein
MVITARSLSDPEKGKCTRYFHSERPGKQLVSVQAGASVRVSFLPFDPEPDFLLPETKTLVYESMLSLRLTGPQYSAHP